MTAISERFPDLATAALDEWVPGASVYLQIPLRGGLSGAEVLLIDVQPGSGSSNVINGQYILKLARVESEGGEELDEASRHARVAESAKGFAKQHVPALVASHRSGEHVAILCHVAGKSLRQLQTLYKLSHKDQPAVCRHVSKDLLYEMNAEYKIDQVGLANRTLIDWLGPRLDPATTSGNRLRQVAAARCDGDLYFTREQILVNPLSVCNHPELASKERPRFQGLLHGDLHGDNVLRLQTDRALANYWVIDFGLSRPGPLFFDHAYLELALIRHALLSDPAPDHRLSRLRLLLNALAAPAGTRLSQVFTSDSTLKKDIELIRDEVRKWQAEKQPHRADPVEAQYRLARVAAGLIWANKRGLDDADRTLSFEYAAWAARDYLEHDHPDVLDSLLSRRPAAPPPPAPEPDPAAWDTFWAAAHGFDRSAARYLLVAGRIDDPASAAALGQLPWSAVLDFDPDSDGTGLFKGAEPILRHNRGCHLVGNKVDELTFDRSCAWMMAGGWALGMEPTPQSQPEWQRRYNEPVRQFLRRFAAAVRPEPVVAIVLPGPGLSGKRLEVLAGTIDEFFSDRLTLLVLHPDLDVSPAAQYFPSLSVPLAVQRIKDLYGTTVGIAGITLPGKRDEQDLTVSVPVERLRVWEEELELLHSGIQTDAAAPAGGFWKGAPPSWADLDERRDVSRTVTDSLLTAVQTKLLDRSTWNIDLWHEPGAGGTTVARRVAWDLRRQFPVAVLRKYTGQTIERLQGIAELTGKPILLVAEQTDLNQHAREALYRGLSIQRVRAVILYVRRVNKLAQHHEHQVGRLTDDEAKRFRAVYAAETDDPDRRAELGLITEGGGKYLGRYRYPFFYGLITYAEDFLSVSSFVQNCIGTTEGNRQKVLLYLALTTNYVHGGLPTSVVREMLGLKPGAALDLEAEFGPGPARLILEYQEEGELVPRLKLLHPVLSVELFKHVYQIAGREWEVELKPLADRFIDDLTRILGKNSEPLHALLTQLLVDRSSMYDEHTQSDGRFSMLVRQIPYKEDAHALLRKLVDVCDIPQTKAHYLTHLSRHRIYELRSEYDQAEAHSLAAIGLDPQDDIHYHTLGMVLRFWAESRVDELAAKAGTGPANVIEAIEGVVERALDAFAKTRELEPEDEHGYITPVQLIARVAEGVLNVARRQAGKPNLGLADLTGGRDRVGQWLLDNLSTAYRLLDEIKHIRGPRPPSLYASRCDLSVAQLYPDNRQELISRWRRQLIEYPAQGSVLQRGLIRLYLMQHQDRPEAIPQATAREIALWLEDSRTASDLRTWFRFFRRLPEFSYQRAVSRAERMKHLEPDAIDTHYYLYILHYLLTLVENKPFEVAVEAEVRECKRLAARSRYRDYGYEWLGNQTIGCPLVHFSELGQWDARTHNYPPAGASKLRVLRGVIDQIEGPERGWIRLGEKLRAFFPPRGDFTQSEHAGRQVQFYLGFTYDGLRAYGVRPITTEPTKG